MRLHLESLGEDSLRLAAKKGLWKMLFTVGKPFRAAAKRWGTRWLKSLAWRAEYRRGQHLHALTGPTRSRICDLLERYANGGDIMDLGCSDGHVGLGLDPEA